MNNNELNEMELDMVNGGYSFGEFWNDVKNVTEKVTNYVPIVREMKDYVNDMNECNKEMEAAKTTGEKFSALGRGLLKGFKDIGKGIADGISGGLITVAEIKTGYKF